ncbi:hypothetical protein ASZ78_007250, partial [Callipepla squamata]
YKPVCKIGEGTFSDVLKMLNLRDGKYYACKCMKQHFKSLPICFFSDKKAGCLSLICELMDMNIYELIKGMWHMLQQTNSPCADYKVELITLCSLLRVMKSIKWDISQRCETRKHINKATPHVSGKSSLEYFSVSKFNMLYFLQQNTLKLADFGSCRTIYSKQPYTEYISTRWYRAPECLLTNGYYSYQMDIWSAGCVFYEITSFQPLFPGSNDLDQISKIHDVIGTPATKTLTKFKRSTILSFHFPFQKGKGVPAPVHNLSAKGLALLYAMIQYDPDERIAACHALQHPYFQELWQVTSDHFNREH